MVKLFMRTGIVLILFVTIRGVCQTPTVTNQEWWFNNSESPLQIALSPKKDRLFVGNYSDKSVKSFRFGCVLVRQSSVKIYKTFKSQDSDGLKPRVGDTIYFESLDDKYFESNICTKGKLTVVKAVFEDGTSYKIRQLHESVQPRLGRAYKCSGYGSVAAACGRP